jgi:hypothetical protein
LQQNGQPASSESARRMPKLPVNQSLCFHQQAKNWQEEVQNISLFVELLSHFDITELMSAIAYSGAMFASDQNDWKVALWRSMAEKMDW